MKSFRTIVSQHTSTHSIDLQTKVLSIGSCFADTIGAKLTSFKCECVTNPFGVLYSPEAIHKTLRYALRREVVPQHTFLQHQEVHVNYDFHSEFSALEKSELEKKINQTISTTHDTLKEAQWLFITYGTAWIYERNDTQEIVANCHKQPSALFNKSLLLPEQIVASFESIHSLLKSLNPSIRIILTVSPVRHIKDTLELNSVSKSALRLACHMLQEKFDNVEYFPAYELLLDDLRDYRFYKEDMIHPSAEAEEYIWEHFITQYGSPEYKAFMAKWKVIQSAMQHKPFHPQTKANQQFLKETLRKIEELKSQVNVDHEVALIRQQII